MAQTGTQESRDAIWGIVGSICPSASTGLITPPSETGRPRRPRGANPQPILAQWDDTVGGATATLVRDIKRDEPCWQAVLTIAREYDSNSWDEEDPYMERIASLLLDEMAVDGDARYLDTEDIALCDFRAVVRGVWDAACDLVESEHPQEVAA